MALGLLDKDTQRKVYLSIAHGRVVHYLPKGEVEEFKNVEGALQDITLRERSFNGKKAPFWYIDLKDGTQTYSLSFPYISGIIKSILLSLASAKGLSKGTRVLIEPYERNGYTKVVVYAEGIKLDWITKELPPTKDIEIGGVRHTDDTERMQFITKIANNIKRSLGTGEL